MALSQEQLDKIELIRTTIDIGINPIIRLRDKLDAIDLLDEEMSDSVKTDRVINHIKNDARLEAAALRDALAAIA